MNPRICDLEQSVLEALATDAMSDELRSHLEGCEACTETAAVSRFMNSFAMETEGSPVPSAGSIFWRARLAEKRRLVERSVASIKLVQKLAALMAIVCLAVVLAVYAPAIARDGFVSMILVLGAIALLAVSVGGVLYLWKMESGAGQN